MVLDDILAYVPHYHGHPFIPKGCNAFSSVIPNITNPKIISHFRPLSLIGDHYSIIDKLLANRLEKVINIGVSLEQSAFVKGR